MEAIKTTREWYQKWWGIIIVIGLFYIFVPYLVWTKTTWHKGIKISITLLCALFLIVNIVKRENKKNEAFNLINKAEICLKENNFDQAIPLLKQARDLDPNNNISVDLLDKISKCNSIEYVKKTLAEMSDDDFNMLKKSVLKKDYFGNEAMNKLFISKLQENCSQRNIIKAVIEKENQIKSTQVKAEFRNKLIEEQFSVWDGSHKNLTDVIKESMNDPKSYKHVKTVYRDMGNYLIVETTFRGKNAFGALILQTVKAKVKIDGEIIKIFD